jgi:hypothetical protein
MSATPTHRESRRSTRVPLKVVIAVEGGAGSLACEGETIVINLHGPLIATATWLSVEMKISIHVYLTHKHATARVTWMKRAMNPWSSRWIQPPNFNRDLSIY